MKFTIFIFIILTKIMCVFSQAPDMVKQFETYHKVNSYLFEIVLMRGGESENHNVFCGIDESYRYYPDGGTIGHCESGLTMSSVVVKVGENLIYVLSVGSISSLKNNETKIMLSSISDGEATILINGVYTKERYKGGVNKYLELVKFDSGTWGSNFWVLIRDHDILALFSLPDVTTKDENELMIFQLYEYFSPCTD